MDNIAGTLTARYGWAKGSNADVATGLVPDSAVRRLTPLECERLQGFPDNYTDLPGSSDTARYKALGNSMAVPVMKWIAKRMAMTDKKESAQ